MLGRCGPRLHDLQNRASLISDTPAAVHPLDETLGEDIEVGHAGCQSLRAFGPVRFAGRQNRHIALEIGHGGEPVWIADQHLENRHLEVHCPTRTRLPRTYFLDILDVSVNLCRLTTFIHWFSLEVHDGVVMAEDSSSGTVLIGVRDLGMVTSPNDRPTGPHAGRTDMSTVDGAESAENPSVGPLIDEPDVDIESVDIAIARGWC